MKQYIMGLITGASLIVCVFVFMGNAPYYDIDDVYKKVSKVEKEVKKISRSLRYGVDCN